MSPLPSTTAAPLPVAALKLRGVFVPLYLIYTLSDNPPQWGQQYKNNYRKGSRFDLNMKFIIKSVILMGGGVVVHPGQPLALLMRSSETHTQTHTCCFHYGQIEGLQPLGQALP